METQPEPNDLSLFEKMRSIRDVDFYAGLKSSSSNHSIIYAGAVTQAKGTPTDPGADPDSGLWSQWSIHGDNGINVIDAWQDYTGAGVRVGIIDDGFNYNHSELVNNFRTDLDYDVLGNDDDSINDADDKHGTWVAQIIGADDNGVGNVGIAFDADLVGVRRGFGAEGNLQDVVDALTYAQENDFDIVNNSWSLELPFGDNKNINFSGTDTADVINKFEDLAEFGRDGLGANIVFGAGNNRASGMSANYKNYQNSPYTIAVAATKEDGTFANFSEAGSNILVSAPGNQVILSDAEDDGTAQLGSGTSFAAPAVSGVVALMLEANADLGYRDVQEILALSARVTDANGTGWAGEGWQTNGANMLNGGGLHFSHDYGFGLVDATAAVRLAETWTLQQTYTNMSVISPVTSTGSITIPDTGDITTTMTIIEDISIEHVLIDLDISHQKAGDLVITLISPDGTESTLVHHISNGAYTTTYGVYTGINFEFSSVAHWGESSAGEWSLRIEDKTAGNTGTLNSWSLSFLGDAPSIDNLYVYTDEYANADLSQTILTDINGGVDTINASAVTTNIDLNLSFAGSIAGTPILIDQNTIIENLYTGDGDDNITGNAANNLLHTGRGDDVIFGSTSDDIIDGAQGTDTIIYSYNINEFVINLIDDFTVTMSHVLEAFTDTILNMEFFEFNGQSFSRSALDIFVNTPETVETRTRLNWDGGRANIKHDTIGEYFYSATDLNFSDNTDTLIRVYREATIYDLSQNSDAENVIETATIRNHDLSEANISGFRVGKVIANESTQNMTVNVTAMAGKILTGTGDDDIAVRIEDLSTEGRAGWIIRTEGGSDTLNLSGNSTQAYTKIYLGEGNDVVTAGSFDENGTFIVNNSKDFIYAGAGDDIIFAGGGDDRIFGQSGFNQIHGGDGNDRLSAGENASHLYGDAGADRLVGSAENDMLYGGADNDVLFGGAGDDEIYGGTGNDVLRAQDGADTLYGDAGIDKLYGEEGDDILFGGADNDRLFGGNGNDRLDGGEGNDYLYAGAGDDVMLGGAGNDRFYGATGVDIFAFTEIDGQWDYLNNYTLGVDVINITDVLEGYDAATDNLNDFVQFIATSSNRTYLQINADGDVGGTFTREAVIFTNFNGQGVNDLLANNTLVADISA